MSTYLKCASRFEGNCICCQIDINKKDTDYVLRSKRRFRLCKGCGDELHQRLENKEALSIVMLSNYKERGTVINQ